MWCSSCECQYDHVDQVDAIQAQPGILNQESPDNSEELPENYEILNQEGPENYVKAFQVTLQRRGASTAGLDVAPASNNTDPRSFAKTLGMVLDASMGVIMFVCKVYDDDCLVGAYNRTAPPEVQLKVGDFIEEVNGFRGNMAIMIQEVCSNSDLTLLVSRSMEYEINVRKKDTLGCDVTYLGSGISLGVARVFDGPIQEWNDKNPSRTVLEGDRIISVNGVRGTTHDLLEMIRTSEELCMSLARPASSSVDEAGAPITEAFDEAKQGVHVV